MGTLTKMVQWWMERFRQKQMTLDQLTQLGWEDAADIFHEKDMQYGTSELRVLAVVQPQTDDDAAAPAPTTFGELMVCLWIVPWISQLRQRTSQPGSSDIRLGSVKPQSDTTLSGLEPAAEPDTSSLLKAKPVEPVSFYDCIVPPANHHIDFRFRWRHGDSSCVSGRIDRQSAIFGVISWRKASCLPTLLCVSFFLISETKLGDMVIRLCMCKGTTHHVKLLESKSWGKMAQTCDFYIHVTVMWQSKS